MGDVSCFVTHVCPVWTLESRDHIRLFKIARVTLQRPPPLRARLATVARLRHHGRMSRLRSIGFAAAALGFVLSALIHLGSYLAAVPMRSVWPLHVGVLALGVPLVVAAQARRRGRFFGPTTRELLQHAPPWGERALQLAFLNFVLQFGALLLATRTVTSDRAAPPGWETRMFSAGWMTAYAFFALAWWRPRPAPRAGG